MFSKPQKSRGRIKMAISGPAGSGKTYSALSIATALGKRVAVLDTESVDVIAAVTSAIDSVSGLADRNGLDVTLHVHGQACSVDADPRRLNRILRNLLENAIEHAVAMSGGATEILPDMLPEEVRQPDRSQVVPSVQIPDEGVNFSSIMSQMERDLILQCLEKTGGNKRQAARLLNLSRTTLIDKLQRLGINDGAA